MTSSSWRSAAVLDWFAFSSSVRLPAPPLPSPFHLDHCAALTSFRFWRLSLSPSRCALVSFAPFSLPLLSSWAARAVLRAGGGRSPLLTATARGTADPPSLPPSLRELRTCVLPLCSTPAYGPPSFPLEGASTYASCECTQSFKIAFVTGGLKVKELLLTVCQVHTSVVVWFLPLRGSSNARVRLSLCFLFFLLSAHEERSRAAGRQPQQWSFRVSTLVLSLSVCVRCTCCLFPLWICVSAPASALLDASRGS